MAYSGKILLFSKLKDEANRIDFFLDYYRRQGVDRFYIIDNSSTDGSFEKLSAQPDVEVFTTDEPLNRQAVWLNRHLQEFGVGHWCLAVDLDEFFVVPLDRHGRLRRFISYLDSRGFDAVRAHLLDLYSDRTLSETVLERGVDPRIVCNYFDPPDPASRDYGGVRKRVFKANPYLKKVPFFKFSRDMEVGPGAHILKPRRQADVIATLLHFKFVSNFGSKVRDAVEGGQYFEGSKEYRQYQEVLDSSPDPVLHHERSIQYDGNPWRLIRHGFQSLSTRYAAHVVCRAMQGD